ncbi:MAG: biotin/lipoyl-containing protein, partial [Acidimicrobiia bacterium]
MSVTITMPQLGETVTEGTILEWVKQVGETVAEDEIIVEISTDKVDTEVPSPASGTIEEILVAAGETVEVGTPLAILSGGDESDAAPAETEPEPQAEAPAVVEVAVTEAPAPVAEAPAAPPSTAPSASGETTR